MINLNELNIDINLSREIVSYKDFKCTVLTIIRQNYFTEKLK